MIDTTVQQNKVWLLKVENLAIVRKCCQCIHKEFGVKLHLDADDLLELIHAYANRSEDHTLRRLARPIAHLLYREQREKVRAEAADIPVVAPMGMPPLGWTRTGH